MYFNKLSNVSYSIVPLYKLISSSAPPRVGGIRPPQRDCHVLFLYLGIVSKGVLLGGCKMICLLYVSMYPCLTLGVLFFKTDTLKSGGILRYASAGEVFKIC